MINFDGIPNMRTPFVAIEFDSSSAGGTRTSVQAYKALLIGQKLSSGSGAPAQAFKVSSVEQAIDLFGSGSMLAAMAKAFFINNTYTECWAVALEDDPSGSAADAKITVTGTAGEDGMVSLYAAGQSIRVPILKGDTQSDIAAKIYDAIESNAEIPLESQAVANEIILQAKHKGAFGNEYEISLNYFSGDSLPSGVGLVVESFHGGAANPNIESVFNAIGDEHFNVIAMPYTDTQNLTTLKTKLDERSGPLKQIEGVAFAAKNVSEQALLSFGDSVNTQHLSVMSSYKVKTPVYEIASAIAGVVSFQMPIDPARPLQTLPLVGVVGPKMSERFTQAQRNALLYKGLSTFVVSQDGQLRIERLITTYQTSPSGAQTDAYLDCETLFTLSYLRFDLRNMILSKYPRSKLASDGTRFGAGAQVVTPRLVKAEILTRFRAWEERGLVENFDQFKDGLIVERNASDPNRLDILMPPDLMNALRVTAAKIKFIV